MAPTSLELAYDDLVTTLTALTWLKVVQDIQEPGSKAYTILVTGGGSTTTSQFGKRKIKQEVNLVLFVKQGVDVGLIASKLDLINEAIIADRRRSTNAQTTIINEWVVEENEGREGLSLAMISEVHVYES